MAEDKAIYSWRAPHCRARDLPAKTPRAIHHECGVGRFFGRILLMGWQHMATIKDGKTLCFVFGSRCCLIDGDASCIILSWDLISFTKEMFCQQWCYSMFNRQLYGLICKRVRKVTSWLTHSTGEMHLYRISGPYCSHLTYFGGSTLCDAHGEMGIWPRSPQKREV